tara:strand:+ start:465 stop:1898 length:1434 start_codon:yes stop_codon:yes gene_type:complete
MAKQVIGIGNAANDGSGDPLRTAGDKVNDNFNEFYSKLGDGTNLHPLTFPSANATVLTTSNADAGILTTSNADADHVLINDGGVLKKITPANLGIGGGGSSGVTVQEEGSALSTAGTTLNFVGAGVTASGTGATKTITIPGGASQNLFDKIAVSGQSNVVADSATDTLTLVAGTNVTITTDANADSITINSTGTTDLNSLTAGVINTQNDSIGFIDADDSNNSKKESIADFLTAIAGSGISVSSGQLTASGGSGNAISQLNSNVTVTDTGTNGTITFDTDGTDRWQFTSAGHLLPVAHETYDIGSATQKVRHLFLSDSSLKMGDSELELSVVSSRLHFNSSKLMVNLSDDPAPQITGDLDVNGKTIMHTFNITASGTDHYVFADTGNVWFPSPENDPTLYLRRGEQYKFNNTSGAHPIRIQSTQPNNTNTNGTAYSTGVTNNAGNGAVIFKVPMSAPATLYYQCTSHPLMNGTINIV